MDHQFYANETCKYFHLFSFTFCFSIIIYFVCVCVCVQAGKNTEEKSKHVFNSIDSNRPSNHTQTLINLILTRERGANHNIFFCYHHIQSILHVPFL